MHSGNKLSCLSGNFTNYARLNKLGRNLALRDALRPIAKRHGTTVSAIAVAWTLAWPGVSGAIVGARSPAQIDGWIDAARLTLTPADFTETTEAIKSTAAGTGPLQPG